jgi:predicted small lipoprotein YifL
MRIAALLGLLALAACGADGPPMRPSAGVGASVGSDGTDLDGPFGLTDGTFSVGLGL